MLQRKISNGNRIALTGIKPTGPPHIGNYLGMIRPALELVGRTKPLYFIADYHALTTTRDPSALNRQIYEVAATWLALGIDPQRVVFFRQSDIPEIFEMAWILSCVTSKGLLNRAHAYKSAVEENRRAGKDKDAGINAGIFNYPVLMAADILLFGTDIVPVGSDQKQHIEISRDIAKEFNNTFGKVFRIPKEMFREEAMTIPGLDGRKMSKSYGNTIPIFAPRKILRKRVMQIRTDSKRPEDPKDPDSCNVFAIYRHVASPEAVEQKRKHYRSGGIAYSDMKQELIEQIEATFDSHRQAFHQFLRNPSDIDDILNAGAVKARRIARPMLAKVRRTIGIEHY